jgi:protein-disulfide isomerase
VALLRRIPQSVNALGSSAAPVTLRFFGDLQCPTSRAFTLEMLPSVIDRWVRTGRLRIEYRALRTATASAKVFMAQQAAALAAGMQGKLWDYIEFFYHEQRREDSGYVNRRFLRSLAEQTPGLDVRQWNGDREETSLAARVALDEQAAARRGLYETPALLIGLTPGRKGGQQGFTPVAPTVLSPAIEGLLGERPRRSSVSASERSGPGRVKVAYRPASGPSRSGGRVAC